MTQLAIPSSGGLRITVHHSGQDAIVRLSGRINVDSSPDLRDRLRAILSTEPLPRTVTVDLAGVPYIETSGIATLIEALRIAAHQQTRFHLQGLDGSVLRLFEVTGALTLFDRGGRGEKVS
jgi:anti-sigma B factor antagonist